jgi:CheY-like chemotaxis protein
MSEDELTKDEDQNIDNLIDRLYEEMGPRTPGSLVGGNQPKKSLGVPGKILIVDDALVTRLMLKKCLESLRCQILEAPSGEEAEQIFAKNSETIELIILDIGLTDQDGITTLAHIRRMDPWVPVIMLTASTSKRNLMTCAKLGITGFFGKPIEPDRFREKIEQILVSRREAAEQATAGDGPKSQARVLMIENSDQVRTWIAWILESYGCQTLSHKDCYSALEGLKRFEPEIILMNCYELDPAIPILLRGIEAGARSNFSLLGYSMSQSQESGIDTSQVEFRGFDQVLPSPFTPENLISAIRRLMGQEQPVHKLSMAQEEKA